MRPALKTIVGETDILASRPRSIPSSSVPIKPPTTPDAWLELPDGRIHPLKMRNSIGRSPDNDLLLPYAGVSRHHATVSSCGSGVYRLSDAGSTNGTFLNGLRVEQPEPMCDKDVLNVGAATLRFHQAGISDFATETHVAAALKHPVLLVEDASMLSDALSRLIESLPEFRVAGHATSAADARRLCAQLHPEAVIIDASLEAVGALSLLRDLITADPDTRPMVLVNRADPDYMTRLLRSGTLGCVLKDDPVEEFQRALNSTLAGNVHLSRRVAAATLRYLSGSAEAGRREGPAGLTDRELEIFHLVGAGRPNRDIAIALGMSVKTVETHKENLKIKLGLPSASAVADCARSWIAGQTDRK
jgi:DNA-binding NarL/FixJ family response regulator